MKASDSPLPKQFVKSCENKTASLSLDYEHNKIPSPLT